MPAEIGFIAGLIAGAIGCWFLLLWRSSGNAAPAPELEPQALMGKAERELETRRLAAENAALITQMADVRERLATLERLAIDRSARLADEIEALRA